MGRRTCAGHSTHCGKPTSVDKRQQGGNARGRRQTQPPNAWIPFLPWSVQSNQCIYPTQPTPISWTQLARRRAARPKGIWQINLTASLTMGHFLPLRPLIHPQSHWLVLLPYLPPPPPPLPSLPAPNNFMTNSICVSNHLAPASRFVNWQLALALALAFPHFFAAPLVGH
jgi:hypothetical protein